MVAAAPGRRVTLKKKVGELTERVRELTVKQDAFMEFTEAWMNEIADQILAMHLAHELFCQKMGLPKEEVIAFITTREKQLREQEEARRAKAKEAKAAAEARAEQKTAEDAKKTEGYIQPVDDWSDAQSPDPNEGGDEARAKGSDEAN